jgi:hypothetical protein
MERRYLAATIAMAATFALFSHAFGSGLLNKVHDPRATLISEVQCVKQTLRARLLDKVNHTLGAANAEEAQLRVELNLPIPAVAASMPMAPAAPVAPMPPVKAAARHALACPSQRLMSDHFSRDFNNKMQAKMMALQSKLLAKQATLQAKLVAQQARLNSQLVEREITRAALVEARTSIAQAKINSHPCSGQRTVHVTTRSDNGDTDIDIDTDQLSRQIEQQVSRSLRNSVRNF